MRNGKVKMKKKLSLLLCTLVAALTVGCGSGQTTNPVVSEVETNKEPLKIGLISSIASLPILIAQEQGYFDEANLEVELEYFKAAKDRDAALQAGTLDGVLCDQIAISIYQNADIDMQITGKTDGSTTIVAGPNSGVEKVEDLVGKNIAISENTMIEYTLDQVLASAGIESSAVEKVSIPSMATRLEMLQSGEIDAAVMPNPYSDTALANGCKSIEVVDSTSDLYTSVTAFKKGILDVHQDTIKKYYEAYDRAVEYINATDVSVYENVIIDTIGYPETMRGNMGIPRFNKNVLPSEASVTSAFAWATEKGLLTKALSPSDVLVSIQ